VIRATGGSTPSKENQEYWEGDIPWVSPKDMKKSRISGSTDHVSGKALEDTGLPLIRIGSVLIVVRGMILAHSVPVAITEVAVTINQDMKALEAGRELSPDYLLLLLSGIRDAVFEYIDSSAHGTKKLEWERFEGVQLPIPPLEDQRCLVSKTEKLIENIDELSNQASGLTKLLQERRSALISAAVTGKIDVRNWQPPTNESVFEEVLHDGQEAAV
jgi:type I restriction enzyme S subunit